MVWFNFQIDNENEQLN